MNPSFSVHLRVIINYHDLIPDLWNQTQPSPKIKWNSNHLQLLVQKKKSPKSKKNLPRIKSYLTLDWNSLIGQELDDNYFAYMSWEIKHRYPSVISTFMCNIWRCRISNGHTPKTAKACCEMDNKFHLVSPKKRIYFKRMEPIINWLLYHYASQP